MSKCHSSTTQIMSYIRWKEVYNCIWLLQILHIIILLLCTLLQQSVDHFDPYSYSQKVKPLLLCNIYAVHWWLLHFVVAQSMAHQEVHGTGTKNKKWQIVYPLFFESHSQSQSNTPPTVERIVACLVLVNSLIVDRGLYFFSADCFPYPPTSSDPQESTSNAFHHSNIRFSIPRYLPYHICRIRSLGVNGFVVVCLFCLFWWQVVIVIFYHPALLCIMREQKRSELQKTSSAAGNKPLDAATCGKSSIFPCCGGRMAKGELRLKSGSRTTGYARVDYHSRWRWRWRIAHDNRLPRPMRVVDCH